jgi:hypothetical protein
LFQGRYPLTSKHATIFKNIDSEIDLRKIAEYKIKKQYQKIRFHMNKYEDKRERMLTKNKNEVEINLDDQ